MSSGSLAALTEYATEDAEDLPAPQSSHRRSVMQRESTEEPLLHTDDQDPSSKRSKISVSAMSQSNDAEPLAIDSMLDPLSSSQPPSSSSAAAMNRQMPTVVSAAEAATEGGIGSAVPRNSSRDAGGSIRNTAESEHDMWPRSRSEWQNTDSDDDGDSASEDERESALVGAETFHPSHEATELPSAPVSQLPLELPRSLFNSPPRYFGISDYLRTTFSSRNPESLREQSLRIEGEDGQRSSVSNWGQGWARAQREPPVERLSDDRRFMSHLGMNSPSLFPGGYETMPRRRAQTYRRPLEGDPVYPSMESGTLDLSLGLGPAGSNPFDLDLEAANHYNGPSGVPSWRSDYPHRQPPSAAVPYIPLHSPSSAALEGRLADQGGSSGAARRAHADEVWVSPDNDPDVMVLEGLSQVPRRADNLPGRASRVASNQSRQQQVRQSSDSYRRILRLARNWTAENTLRVDRETSSSDVERRESGPSVQASASAGAGGPDPNILSSDELLARSLQMEESSFGRRLEALRRVNLRNRHTASFGSDVPEDPLPAGSLLGQALESGDITSRPRHSPYRSDDPFSFLHQSDDYGMESMMDTIFRDQSRLWGEGGGQSPQNEPTSTLLPNLLAEMRYRGRDANRVNPSVDLEAFSARLAARNAARRGRGRGPRGPESGAAGGATVGARSGARGAVGGAAGNRVGLSPEFREMLLENRRLRLANRASLDQRLDALETAMNRSMPLHLQLATMDRDFTEDDYDLLLQLDDIPGEPSRKGARPAIINALPTSVVDETTENMSSCAVCLEDPVVGDELRKLPCQHSFHKQCIDEWLKRQALCPICKRDIRP